MNPIRAIFLALSRTPPAMVLLIIISLAIIVTMSVTGAVSQAELSSDDESVSDSARHAEKAPVIVSTKPIAEGATITEDMVKQRRVHEINIWEDTVTAKPNAVGRVAKHAIPGNAQIREIDLK